MSGEAHWRALERLYHAAPTNRYLLPRLTIGDCEARIVVTIRPEFHHAAGAVHGSVYFKLLDDAAFFAANSVVEEEFLLTAQFNLYFLRPVVAGDIVATGRLIDRTRRTWIGEARLVDEAGRLLAQGSGSFMRSGIPLDEKVGYR